MDAKSITFARKNVPLYRILSKVDSRHDFIHRVNII